MQPRRQPAGGRPVRRSGNTIDISVPVNATIMGLVERISRALNTTRSNIVRSAVRAYIGGRLTLTCHDITRVEPLNMTVATKLPREDVEKVRRVAWLIGRSFNDLMRDIVYSYAIALQAALSANDRGRVEELLHPL